MCGIRTRSKGYSDTSLPHTLAMGSVDISHSLLRREVILPRVPPQTAVTQRTGLGLALCSVCNVPLSDLRTLDYRRV
jgi:hypothetical protein